MSISLKSLSLIGGLAVSVVLTGCISAKFAKPVSFQELGDPGFIAKNTTENVGYTDSNGVPSLAERFAKRPDLKVSVLQYGLYMQGDISREFSDTTYFSAMAATYGGHYMTKVKTTVAGVEVPADIGLHLATDGIKKLEAALAAQGFEVIPYTTIANTKAYQQAYGAYPPFAVVEQGSNSLTSMAAGWTGFAPQHYRIEPPSGVIAIGQAHGVWPDTVALQNIQQELGQDVIFLTVAQKFSNHEIVGEATKRTRLGKFGGDLKVGVDDPAYVGYGIGGFGHIATNFDMHLDPAARPEFIADTGNGFETDWNLLVKEAELANSFYAQGIAAIMKEKKLAQ